MSTFISEWGIIVESRHRLYTTPIIYYILGSLIFTTLYAITIMMILKIW